MTLARRGAARGDLLDAALRLLADRPPSAISGREIAEEAGVKLAMHPDDPPLSPIRGIGRILTSPENF